MTTSTKYGCRFVWLAGVCIALLAGNSQATVEMIGPGADLAGATAYDTPGGDRVNVARIPGSVTLDPGVYNVHDFQLSVRNHDAGTSGKGIITPMLLAQSSVDPDPLAYTTLWIGDAFDPKTNGIQTAAAYTPTNETFTLTTTTEVFGGIFTGNGGSAIPGLKSDSTYLTAHHGGSNIAPDNVGDTVSGFGHPELERAYAFEISVGKPDVVANNGGLNAAGDDLLESFFGSVANTGVGGVAGDGPIGSESVLRDGIATDRSGYATGSETATRMTNGNSLTYHFDLSRKELGFQIDQIDLFHGWKDGGRDWISDFDVFYSTVDDPNTFIPIYLGGDSGNYASNYGRTSVVPESGSPYLATGAAAVQIVFNSIENGYGGISEIDVLGSVVVIPEPATLLIWSLLAALGVGLAWRRR